MAIPVPKIACPLAETSVPLLAYKSCPDTFADPLVGTLAFPDSFLILTHWSLAVGPFLARTLENVVTRFSSEALSSGTAYATGKPLRHQVVHRSLLHLILLSLKIDCWVVFS